MYPALKLYEEFKQAWKPMPSGFAVFNGRRMVGVMTEADVRDALQRFDEMKAAHIGRIS